MNEGKPPVRTAEADGIAVKKTVEGGDDGATATLEVTSRRDEPAVVEVIDPALEAIAEERIEVLGAETPRRPERAQPVFERELGSGESWSVSYRVADAAPERLDSKPEVALSDEDGIEALLDRSRSEMLRGFVSGDRESLSAEASADAADTTDSSVSANATDADDEESDGRDRSEPAGAEIHPAEETHSVEETHPIETSEPTDAEGVAHTLLAELRSGEIDRETKAALRAELAPSRSRELRLKHLQRQVSDLTAYTEMLEVFIDEYGPLDEAVEGIDSDLQAIKSEQADIEARMGSLEAELERVDDRLDELERFRDSLSGAFRDLGGDD
jgi:hypothetical protein